jgi:hypothetical protein
MTPSEIAHALFPGERMFEERRKAVLYLDRNPDILKYFESHLSSLAEVLEAEACK